MSTENQIIKANQDNHNIQALLGVLKNLTTQRLIDIESAEWYHEQGLSTELAQRLAQLVKDPLRGLHETFTDLQNVIVQIIDSLVKRLVKERVEAVDSIYKVSPSKNGIFYFIVLKEDTEENRDTASELLDYYEQEFELAQSFPLHFQFIPLELKDEIAASENIQSLA